MTGDVTPYTSLVTSEFQKPDFLAVVRMLCQGHADNIALLQAMSQQFDVDSAVGAQLDVVGEWVGVSRYLEEPLADVYFTWGAGGQGWGDGVWKFPFDPDDGLTVLPDAQYRVLILATIAANQWDGSIPDAYAVWDLLFAGSGTQIAIQDFGDMTMALGLLCTTPPDAVTAALFENGALDLKPGGVGIRYRYINSGVDVPVFAWGVPDGPNFAGWAVGSWANIVSGE